MVLYVCSYTYRIRALKLNLVTLSTFCFEDTIFSNFALAIELSWLVFVRACIASFREIDFEAGDANLERIQDTAYAYRTSLGKSRERLIRNVTGNLQLCDKRI